MHTHVCLYIAVYTVGSSVRVLMHVPSVGSCVCVCVCVHVCVYVCVCVYQHVAYDYAKRVSSGMATAEAQSANLLSSTISVGTRMSIYHAVVIVVRTFVTGNMHIRAFGFHVRVCVCVCMCVRE